MVRQRRDPAGLRVLDLACRTGAFSTAFSQTGAAVLGIEGRRENYDRILPTHNAEFVLGDVRDLDPEVHGVFDVTLCLGILYHLDAEDAVKLLRAMRAVTTGFAVIDTHVATAPSFEVAVEGHRFVGQVYPEPPGLWSAIGNPKSFWFTPESLDAAVSLAGWSEIEHHPGIRWPGEPAGRKWLVIS